jgi:hypothetical protein
VSVTICDVGPRDGCPFEGAGDPVRVLELAERLAAADADEIVLADTIGVAVPRQVRQLVAECARLGRPPAVAAS